jgi:hypothetical protein
MNWQKHVPNIFSIGFNVTFIRFFRLKDVKELVYAAFGKITKDVWTKAEEHVVKI